MKTWEMIRASVQGNTWYSETLGYPIIHTHKGFLSKYTKASVKLSNRFLRASDWKKIES